MSFFISIDIPWLNIANKFIKLDNKIKYLIHVWKVPQNCLWLAKHPLARSAKFLPWLAVADQFKRWVMNIEGTELKEKNLESKN